MNPCWGLIIIRFFYQCGYLWNWIESYRLSKRKIDCLTNKTLARRNHALPPKIFLSQRRSVQVHWFWQWWSCRLFVFRLRSRLLSAERDRCKWSSSNGIHYYSILLRSTILIDFSVDAADEFVDSRERDVEESMLKKEFEVEAEYQQCWWIDTLLSTERLCWSSR